MHCKNPTKMKTAKERAATKNRRESKSNAVAFLADAQFLFLVDIVLIRCTSDVWRFGTFFSLDDNHYYDKEGEMREILTDFDTHFLFERRSFVRLHFVASQLRTVHPWMWCAGIDEVIE